MGGGNIKMDLRYGKGINWIDLAQDRRGGGLLWIRWWTFGLLKLRGISWVAEELYASQEEPCCMELECESERCQLGLGRCEAASWTEVSWSRVEVRWHWRLNEEDTFSLLQVGTVNFAELSPCAVFIFLRYLCRPHSHCAVCGGDDEILPVQNRRCLSRGVCGSPAAP